MRGRLSHEDDDEVKARPDQARGQSLGLLVSLGVRPSLVPVLHS
jgi:hypothetical protein